MLAEAEFRIVLNKVQFLIFFVMVSVHVCFVTSLPPLTFLNVETNLATI